VSSEEALAPVHEDLLPEEEVAQVGGHLGALLAGCAVSSSLALARLIEAIPDGKLVSLAVLSMAIAGIWVVLTRPNLTVVVLVSYLPFSQAYPAPIFGLPGLNGSNLALGVGIAGWIASGLRRERRPFGPFEYVLLLYLLLGALGAIRGQLRGGGIDFVDLAMDYRWWVAPPLLFFVARGTVEEEDDANAILIALAYVTFLIAALTWMEGISLRDRRDIEQQRVSGVLGQPNTMGAFLAYYGAPLLALAVSRGRWLVRGLALAAFLVTARAIIFTFSRGALLALGVGSAAVVGMVSPVGVGAVAAVGLVARSQPQYLPDSVRDRFAQTATEDTEIYADDVESRLDKSSAERLNLWRGGLEIMRRHPIAGVGLKTFARAVPAYTPVPIEEGGARDAHNAYILTGAELGVPAVLLLVGVLIRFGFATLGSWRHGRDPAERRLALACLGCLTAVIVSCMFGSRFAEDALIGGFWMINGTLFALRMREEPEDEEAEDEGDFA
jgi:O-antigen ligase